jgi:hypothetical protein
MPILPYAQFLETETIDLIILVKSRRESHFVSKEKIALSHINKKYHLCGFLPGHISACCVWVYVDGLVVYLLTRGNGDCPLPLILFFQVGNGNNCWENRTYQEKKPLQLRKLNIWSLRKYSILPLIFWGFQLTSLGYKNVNCEKEKSTSPKGEVSNVSFVSVWQSSFLDSLCTHGSIPACCQNLSKQSKATTTTK